MEEMLKGVTEASACLRTWCGRAQTELIFPVRADHDPIAGVGSSTGRASSTWHSTTDVLIPDLPTGHSHQIGIQKSQLRYEQT